MSGGRYRFGEVTHRGLLGAIRPGQLALVAAGAVWAIAVIDISSSGSGAVAALAGLAVAVMMATVPVGGRTLDQWLPIACAWLARDCRVAPVRSHRQQARARS